MYSKIPKKSESLVVTQKMGKILSCVTLIKELLQIVETGDYRKPEKKELEKNWEEVGEMSLMEKAVYTLFYRKWWAKSVHDSFTESGFTNTRDQLLILNALLWQMIEERLEIGCNDIAIGKDYKIYIDKEKGMTVAPRSILDIPYIRQ